MINYLLDTDTCIFLLKDKYGSQERVKAIGIEYMYASEITLAELHFGAYYSTNFEKHRHDAERISSIVTVLSISDALLLYGKERARLRRLGTPIAEFDLLIATTAVHHGMTLVTNNTKHHKRVAGIQLENWAVPV